MRNAKYEKAPEGTNCLRCNSSMMQGYRLLGKYAKFNKWLCVDCLNKQIIRQANNALNKFAIKTLKQKGAI